jgi:ATP synthase protein I
MQAVPSHSGEMSQDPIMAPLHRSPVTERRSKRVDEVARKTKGFYTTLSATSVGLELGISVILGLLFGRWLDSEAGTEPWLMILFLCFGFAAGIRGVIRAVKRADNAAQEDARG